MTDAQVVYQQKVHRNYGRMNAINEARDVMRDETYPVSYAWHHPPNPPEQTRQAKAREYLIMEWKGSQNV